MAKRYEKIRLDAKAGKTTQGFLRAPAYLTRTGVFTYRNTDGSIARRELRHPDDVFNEDSMATLRMAPVTHRHPKEGFVKPDNAKQLAVGWASDQVSREDQYVRSDLVVSDEKAIEAIEKGTVELSCGYEADVIPEKGVFDGEEYDHRQTNIRYNHVALVERGRAGPSVRLHLDSEDAVMASDDYETTTEDSSMKKIKIDGVEFEVSEAVATALEAQLAKTEETAGKLATETARADSAEQALAKTKEEAAKDKDGLQAKFDALESKLKAHNDSAVTPEQVQQLVQERKQVEKVAEAVLGTEAKLDSVSNLEVMKQVIAKKHPELKLDEKSETYVKARFDAIAEDTSATRQRVDQASSLIGGKKREATELDSAAARERQRNDATEAYKQPLSASKK